MKDGLSVYCKDCRKLRRNPVKDAENRRIWIGDNPKKRLLYSAKTRAKRREIPFNLVETDIEVPEKCPILGIALVFAKGRKEEGSATLDRIIPGLGYVRGNVVVISYRANRIKNDATPEELRKIADFYNR